MESTLIHYGILGMKWGVRRYQNSDGSLTSAGKKRYGDDKDPTKKESNTLKNEKAKKVAVGVAAGATVVAGAVLTAYLVKKYGGKNISDMASTAEIGKDALDKLLDSGQAASTPISQIPKPKVEPKEVLEKVLEKTPASAPSPRVKPKEIAEKVAKSAPITSTPISRTPRPQVTISKPVQDIPQTYDFETLMKQNKSLLEKMYAELA